MANHPRKAFPFVSEGKTGQCCSVYLHIISVIFTYFRLRDLVSLPLGGWYQQMGSFPFPFAGDSPTSCQFSFPCVECGICVCVCRPTLCQGKETSGTGLECAVGPLKMLINSEQTMASKINGGLASSPFPLLKGKERVRLYFHASSLTFDTMHRPQGIFFSYA